MNELLPKELLEIIACPICKAELKYYNGKLLCTKCQAEYEVENGIPILLPTNLLKDCKALTEKWDSRYAKGQGVYDDPLSDPYVADSLRHIKRFWDQNKSGIFLEAGCGTAKNAQVLARENTRVVGVDISIGALKIAKKHFQRENLRGFFVCGDLRSLPFRDGVFRFIFAGGSIEHFRETELAVKELRRVLVSEGLLSATVPVVSISMLTYGQLCGNIPDVPVLHNLAEFIHIKLLKGKLMRFGYEMSFYPRKIRKIFANAGFPEVTVGMYETYYEFKFFRSRTMKHIAKKLVVLRPFWPMIYINAQK